MKRGVGGTFQMLRVILVEGFLAWRRDHAVELGAALAYYTVFSLAPLLVIVIAVAGMAFGRQAAQGEIFAQFRGLMGADGARALEAAVESASRPATGLLATVIGAVMLLTGASGVFVQLRSSLNKIWGADTSPASWKGLLRHRLLSFAMVLAIGFLLLVSLVASAGLAALGRWLGQLGGVLPYFKAADALLSYAVLTLLFAVLFKMLPDVQIEWRDVWVGAAITALLFDLGKTLIGFYVSKSGVGSAYGLAGSILVVLAWLYYSAQIFFFGAECTEVYANRFGSTIRTRRRPPGHRDSVLTEAREAPRFAPPRS